MKSTLRAFCISLILIHSIFLMGCSKADINKVVGMLGEAPGIIAAFALPGTVAEPILNGINDVTAAVTSYRDNPSNSTFTKALDAFDVVLNGQLLSGLDARKRQVVSGFLLTARVAFRFFAPATMAEMDSGSEDGKAAKRERDQAFKDLDRAFDELRDAR